MTQTGLISISPRVLARSSDWFDQHQPTRARPIQRRPRIDWSERDRTLLPAARAAVERLRHQDPPIRLTFGRIAAEIGQASLLQQHLARLPLTRAYLHGVVESRVDYAARKVRRRGAVHRAAGTIPPRWLLVREASLRPELAAAVEDELKHWTEVLPSSQRLVS
jgi:hypothetical protein